MLRDYELKVIEELKARKVDVPAYLADFKVFEHLPFSPVSAYLAPDGTTKLTDPEKILLVASGRVGVYAPYEEASALFEEAGYTLKPVLREPELEVDEKQVAHAVGRWLFTLEAHPSEMDAKVAIESLRLELEKREDLTVKDATKDHFTVSRPKTKSRQGRWPAFGPLRVDTTLLEKILGVPFKVPAAPAPKPSQAQLFLEKILVDIGNLHLGMMALASKPIPEFVVDLEPVTKELRWIRKDQEELKQKSVDEIRMLRKEMEDIHVDILSAVETAHKAMVDEIRSLRGEMVMMLESLKKVPEVAETTPPAPVPETAGEEAKEEPAPPEEPPKVSESLLRAAVYKKARTYGPFRRSVQGLGPTYAEDVADVIMSAKLKGKALREEDLPERIHVCCSRRQVEGFVRQVNREWQGWVSEARKAPHN